MMSSQDFSDSSDESDLDYKPPGETENLSEIDSDDPIEEEDNVNTFSKTSKKTAKKCLKSKRISQKKLKKTEINDETVEKTKEEVNVLLNSSEDDKKRLDALWEEFQRPTAKKNSSHALNVSENKSKLKESLKVPDKLETAKKRNIEELFDYADSSKKMEKLDDNKIKSDEPKIVTVTNTVKKSPGGLANILSQIGKKSKLTILEKSKQDWDGYKKEEGIAEELITYNKGKDGYLEKRDFLERTDLRQFELEKAMRAANRSRRN